MNKKNKVNSPLPMISAKVLSTKKFPTKEWPIEDILPEGVALLVGKPKVGKSCLALNLAVIVASGGVVFNKFKTKQGRVLYLTFEEEEDLIGERLKMQGLGFPTKLKISCLAGMPDVLGKIKLVQLLNCYRGTNLVIIDMLKHIRPLKHFGKNAYQDDSDFISGLKEIASRYRVTILLLHHQRKMKSDDQLDVVLGTTGITGAVDVIWNIERKLDQLKGILKITGRRVKSRELELYFDPNSTLWNYKKESNEPTLRHGQSKIYEFLKQSKRHCFPRTIAEKTGKTSNNVVKLLRSLLDKGLVRKDKNDKYYVPNFRSVI